MEALTCATCGATGFGNAGALGAHKRYLGCGSKRSRSPIVGHNLDPPVHANFDPPAPIFESHEDDTYFSIFEEDDSKAPYDSTFSLVHWIRTCRNNGGLSIRDINILFNQVLFHPCFKLEEVSVRSAADLESYEGDTLTGADGWKHELIQGHILHYRDPIDALGSLFSSPVVAEGFEIYPSSKNLTINEKVYSTPNTTNWWEQMQEHVNTEGAVISPLIFYSDQTSLSKDGKVSGHPLVLSIGNISCENRYLDEGHALLAIFPILPSTESTHLERLQLFQSCLEHILEPLKEASKTGILLLDPNGEERWVYPRLYAYVCDHPEGCKVTCTFDTNKCMLPCSMCFCPSDKLRDVHEKFPYRTETEMKSLLEEIKRSSPSKAIDLSKRYSIHPIQCALWGFAGGDTIFGNPYRAVNVDMLHQFDLGVFKTLVDILRSIATSTSTTILPELDQRLLCVKNSSRFSEFRVPGTDKGGYFTSNSNYAAFEHRSVMQVIVVCIVGLFRRDIIKAVVKFLRWYEKACRSKEHTEESLTSMDQLMQEAIEAFTRALSRWQKSDFHLVKVHAMSHFSDAIRRSGTPFEYSSNLYEHLHIALMKATYRRSNRKDYINYIVKHNRRLQALRKNAQEREGFAPTVEKTTALDLAVEVGQNILAGYQTTLRIRTLALDGIATSSYSNPSKLQRILFVQPEIGSELIASLKTYTHDNNLNDAEVLQIYGSLAIPPGGSPRFGDWPMYARASHEFHGKEWYSSVSIQMEDVGEEEKTSYGQLRLLFRCSLLDAERNKVTKDLALVRMYQYVRFNTTMECVELKWSEAQMEAYVVIEIASILKVVQVVPHFMKVGFYFVNSFKF